MAMGNERRISPQGQQDSRRRAYQKLRPSGQAMTSVLAQYGQKSMMARVVDGDGDGGCSGSVKSKSKQTASSGMPVHRGNEEEVGPWLREGLAGRSYA